MSLEPTVEDDFTFVPTDANEAFPLDRGGVLRRMTLRYAMYGNLSANRDNVILVCHALSGSARVADWWPALFGRDLPLDPTRFAILGVNVLGSCYGSTGPTSINPDTRRPYGGDFPILTVYDMVRAQALLLDHLGIDHLHAVIGGSIGGMQALAWAVNFPQRVPRCLVVGAAPLTALGLALNHLQRQAIRNDPDWQEGRYEPGQGPRAGLALARALAMCSYKSAELFQQRFARKPDRSGEDPAASHLGRFDVAGYLDHQGRIFNERFDANSYLTLSRAMDLFDLGAGAEEEAQALARIRARVCLVGIRSDWLFPPADIRALAERMVNVGVEASYAELNSDHGHDAFLADAAELVPLFMPTLDEEPAKRVGSR